MGGGLAKCLPDGVGIAKLKPLKSRHLICMTIQFFGVSCFKITTKIGNEEVSLVTDPYSAKLGKLPRNLAGDIDRKSVV